MSKKSKAKKQTAPEPVAPPVEGGIVGHLKRHWKFWVKTLAGVIIAAVGGGAAYYITAVINNTAVSNNAVGGDIISGNGNTVSIDRSTATGDRITVGGTNNIVAGSNSTIVGNNSTVAVGDGSSIDIDKIVNNTTNVTNIISVIYNTSNVYNVTAIININGGSLGFSSLNDALRGLATAVKSPGAPVENAKVTLRDPNGLRAIAEKTETYYLAAQVKEAVECAKIGEEIIAPIITPYANKSCSIERKFATNITRIYLVLAEDAWARDDYTTAKKYSHIILGIWGPHVTGDVAGIAAAIDLDERGGSDSVLCEEAVRRFKRGDKEWLYQYLNRLARWGYAHPVAIDSKTKVPYLVSLEKMFGLPRKLQYGSPYTKTTFSTKDGRMLGNGELNVRIYQGMGRFTEGYIPDPNGRDFPPDFTGDVFMPTAKKVNGRPRPVPAELQPKE